MTEYEPEKIAVNVNKLRKILVRFALDEGLDSREMLVHISQALVDLAFAGNVSTEGFEKACLHMRGMLKIRERIE